MNCCNVRTDPFFLDPFFFTYLSTNGYNFVLEFSAEIGVPSEEVDMFYAMPVESIEPPQAPVLVLAASRDGEILNNSKSAAVVRKMGVCIGVFHNSPGAVDPIQDVLLYLDKYDSVQGSYYRSNIKSADIKVGIEQPVHGQVLPRYPGTSSVAIEKAEEKHDYYYVADKDYEGEDRFVVEVSIDGMKFKIFYYVFNGGYDEDPRLNCGAEMPELWEISSAYGSGGALSINSMRIMLGISSGLNVQFSNLNDASLGHATGTGSAARITLDATAAGHGWFIDARKQKANKRGQF